MPQSRILPRTLVFSGELHNFFRENLFSAAATPKLKARIQTELAGRGGHIGAGPGARGALAAWRPWVGGGDTRFYPQTPSYADRVLPKSATLGLFQSGKVGEPGIMYKRALNWIVQV